MEVCDWNQVPRRGFWVRRLRRHLASGAALALQQGEHQTTLTRCETAQPALWQELMVPTAKSIARWLPMLGQAGLRVIREINGPLILETHDHMNIHRESPLRVRVVDHPALQRLVDRASQPLVQVPGLVPQIRLRLEHDPRPVPRLHVAGATWRVLDPGPYSPAQLDRRLTRRVVFVCTGNTCRSPLAEVFLKKSLATRLGCALSDLPAHGWRIDSAGIHARDGQPASAAAHAAAQTRGLSLEGHRSRLLRPEELADADDLIALGRSHREAIRAWREGACVRLLHTDGVDIADPFGGPREVYEACAREIQQHVDHLAEQLLQSEAIPPVAELRQQAGFPHE